MTISSNYGVTIPLSESDFKRVSALFFGIPYFGFPGIAALGIVEEITKILMSKSI